MFEQFDDDIMKKALKRPFPVEDDLPQAFRDLLGRLDGPPDDARAGSGRAESGRASGRGTRDAGGFVRHTERQTCE